MRDGGQSPSASRCRRPTLHTCRFVTAALEWQRYCRPLTSHGHHFPTRALEIYSLKLSKHRQHNDWGCLAWTLCVDALHGSLHTPTVWRPLIYACCCLQSLSGPTNSNPFSVQQRAAMCCGSIGSCLPRSFSVCILHVIPPCAKIASRTALSLKISAIAQTPLASTASPCRIATPDFPCHRNVLSTEWLGL